MAHGGAFEAHGANGEKMTFGIWLPVIMPESLRYRD
jgi:hypothetical protein